MVSFLFLEVIKINKCTVAQELFYMTTVCALKYMLENDTTIKEAAEEFEMNVFTK